MAIIAAFRWDTSNKTISYIILNESPFAISDPVIVNCDSRNYRQLIKRTVKDFFRQLQLAKSRNRNIIIHYKTYMGNGLLEDYVPLPETRFVDDEFKQALHFYGLENKAHKMRSLLGGRKKVTRFKRFVAKLCYDGKNIRSDVYKLWEIAFHMTKANYHSAIRKIYRTVTGNSLQIKTNKAKFRALWEECGHTR